jgi:hypothetical protein
MRPLPRESQHQLLLLPPSFLLRTRSTLLIHNNHPITPLPLLTPTKLLPDRSKPASNTQNKQKIAPPKPNLSFTIPSELTEYLSNNKKYTDNDRYYVSFKLYLPDDSSATFAPLKSSGVCLA